ncbi:hypothetical protein BDW59DRAFT_154427 [Aspergillus cavernicola]|uniref:Uncharacterized protein n=1 Tax=Aspergillus cavernicola TaxID=176166 RepID=A0ABR4HHW8_9EURO
MMTPKDSAHGSHRFCTETKRDARELMAADPPDIRTLFNFFDYTITTRREYIDAASTIQTYWNYWALIRKQDFGLSIPPSIKDGMVGVSISRCPVKSSFHEALTN